MYTRTGKLLSGIIRQAMSLDRNFLRCFSSKDPCNDDPCMPDTSKVKPCMRSPCPPDPCKKDPCQPDPCKPNPCRPDPCKPDPCKYDPCRPDPCAPKPCQYKQQSADPCRQRSSLKGKCISDIDDSPKPCGPWKEQPKIKDTRLRNALLTLAAILAALYTLWKLGFFDRKPKPQPKKPKPDQRIPKDSSEIPPNIPYLLIGGGTASLSAIRAIKSKDPQAKILVINREIDYPYMRPPLSKELWFSEDTKAVENLKFKQWDGQEKSLFFEEESFYTQCIHLRDNPDAGVAVARGWDVVRIDAKEQKAYLDDGYEIKYGKCLVATGGTPKSLSLIDSASPEVQERVILYRSIPDFKSLYKLANESKSITVLGGGFLGSELACALVKKGKKAGLHVTQIFPEKGNMGKILPNYLSNWTTNKVCEEGVEVIAEVFLEDLKREKNQLILTLSNGKQMKTDRLVVAVGIEPNTELAEVSDLEIDEDCGGYVVNAELMARTNLWVAGDCSCFYDVKLGRRRVEHHDHAVVSGQLAGENMTGAANPYKHQSMFWSDLGPNVGYEAIGIVDSCLPTVGVFAKSTERDTPKACVTATGNNIRSETEQKAPPVKPCEADDQPPEGDYGKGVIYYLRDDVIVGIVLWNVFNRMNVARQILQEDKKYEDINEVTKLFNLNEK